MGLELPEFPLRSQNPKEEARTIPRTLLSQRKETLSHRTPSSQLKKPPPPLGHHHHHHKEKRHHLPWDTNITVVNGGSFLQNIFAWRETATLFPRTPSSQGKSPSYPRDSIMTRQAVVPSCQPWGEAWCPPPPCVASTPAPRRLLRQLSLSEHTPFYRVRLFLFIFEKQVSPFWRECWGFQSNHLILGWSGREVSYLYQSIAAFASFFFSFFFFFFNLWVSFICATVWIPVCRQEWQPTPVFFPGESHG